jgi:hypothetical protein
MEAQLKNAGDEERYAYMFRFGNRRFLFIRHFGSGMQSVAQLVKDIDSGDNLVRKVPARRLLHFLLSDEDRRLKKPNEIRMLGVIEKTFKDPEPGLPAYISKCYGHEFIRSKYPEKGRQMYHSISYWQLYNGESVRTRWRLDPCSLPPASLIARMIRQVLSTLHYLYTAGDQPIYHDDLHLGNVWIHWPADTALPDFYLGDFSEASFANSKFRTASFETQIRIGHPVNDLRKFSSNIEDLLKKLDERPEYAVAYGQTGLGALGRLLKAMKSVVTDWETAANTLQPPSLKLLIRRAQDLEEIFGEGGVADETQSKAYTEFVTEVRGKAREFQREQPLIVCGSKQEALRPMVVDGPGKSLLPILGPWQLVTVGWLPAEAEGVTHHRPNDGRFNPGEPNLSVTHRPYGILEPVFLSPESDESWERTSAFASGSGGENVLHSASDCSPPASSPARSMSWKQMDDAAFHTTLGPHPPSSPTASCEKGDDAAFHTTSDCRPPSWEEGDDAAFQAASNLPPSCPYEPPRAIGLASSVLFYPCEERAWAFQVECRATTTVQRWDGSARKGNIKRDKTRLSHVLKAGETAPRGQPSQPKHAAIPGMAVVELKETAFDFGDPENVV